MIKTSKIIKLFDIKQSRSALYTAENKGIIPKSKRKKEGALYTRYWETADLPKIGENFGFLKKPTKQKIIAIYTPKGGVLKSTLTLNFARILALHNIKTLVIGLDIQGTITELLSPSIVSDETELDNPDIENLTEKDLYCFATKQKTLDQVIHKTDIPTLSYIPETTNLNLLEKYIRDVTKREVYFSSSLFKNRLQQFDVILFDNSPNWNFLIQNSLSMATDVISPISCEVNTFHSISQNIQIIQSYKEEMDLDWDNFILIPTKVQNTKISKEIEARYRTMSKLVTHNSIKMASEGDKSNLSKTSVFEMSSNSILAEEYKALVQEIWQTLN